MTEAIERTLELSAEPARVWSALTETAELIKWFPAEAEFDLRPGGEGWFAWPEHGRFALRVETVEPPLRLAWRWARDRDVAIDDGRSTLVEWTLEPREDGGTRLSLRESGFARDEDRRGNEEGWTEELAELESLLASPAAKSLAEPIA